MIAGVICLPRLTLYDDPFRATVLSGAPRFDVILPILAAGELPFTILKVPATDIARRRMAASILYHL